MWPIILCTQNFVQIDSELTELENFHANFKRKPPQKTVGAIHLKSFPDFSPLLKVDSFNKIEQIISDKPGSYV